METTLLLVILSAIGLTLSLFLGCFLLLSQRLRSISNTLLGLLLIFLSIRIGKAIFYNFTELPLFIKNIGLAANLAIGPLLYFYGKALIFKSLNWKWTSFLHFMPAVLYGAFCWYIPNATGDIYWKIGYSLILLQSYTYVFLSLRMLYQHKDKTSLATRQWYRNLSLGLLTMWVVYGLVFVELIPYHIAGTLSFSVLMAVIAFIAFQKGRAFDGSTLRKYKNSTLSELQAQKNLNHIRQEVQKNKLFLEPDLSLNRLAEITSLHPKVISESINRCERQNFAQFINTYRINEAKKLLKDAHANHKIIAVAYNSGFNSLSAFNFTFKKFTSYTPTEFRSLV
ncbi:MAG: helix-turn-helix domain-containing protein [Flavobacteriaceae bacterium]